MAQPMSQETQESNAAALGSTPPRRADILGLIIFCLICINLAVLGGLGYVMQKMWGKMQDLQEQIQKADEQTTEEENPIGKEFQPAAMGTLYPIEGFLVNISSDQGPKFLQTQMELELADPGLEEEISRKKAAIRDAVIVLLSSRTFKELREPNGMKKLRADLLKAINNLLSSGKVKELYFTQFHFN